MSALSRRAMLRATAATAALGAGPAISATIAQPDPLIALGEAERAAHGKFCDANLDLDRAQGAFLEKHGRWPSEDHDAALCDARGDAEEAWEDVLAEMAITPATTLAGIAVKLRIVGKDLSEGATEHTDGIMESALADLDRLSRSA